MNVLLLAAGAPVAASEADAYPIILAELNGQPLIQHLLERCADLDARFVVALAQKDVKRYHLDNVIGLLAPGARVYMVNERTRGAACTALLSLAELPGDDELLILNGNELIDGDFAAIVAGFRARGLDAGVVTFPSVHPRYSYVRLNEQDEVVEAAEKNPISRHATAGFYWFARTGEFVEAVKDMIRKDASVNGLYYVCPALNELVLRQRRIGLHRIPAHHYRPIKNEHQAQLFESSSTLKEA